MNSPTQSLASLFVLETEDVELWRPDELAAVFSHQMSARLGCDLNVKTGEAIYGELTFGAFFDQPAPQLNFLIAVKDFAKACGSASDHRLPRQVSAVLYLVAIAAALLRCDERISDQSSAALQKKMSWAASLEWLDVKFRDLLREASIRI